MSGEEPQWRKAIVERLSGRNLRNGTTFVEIITQNNRLYDATNQLRSENLKLSVENEQLRYSLADSALTPGGQHSGTGGTATPNGGGHHHHLQQSSARIQALEKRLMTQQEELTELHKRKGENAQRIVDLNIKLEEQTAALTDRTVRLGEQVSVNNTLRAEVNMLMTSLHELKGLNACLRDEHTALQLAFTSLEEKLRRVQDENRELVERLMKYKSKDVDKMNDENDSFLRKRSDKMRRELEDAAREGTPAAAAAAGGDRSPSNNGGAAGRAGSPSPSLQRHASIVSVSPSGGGGVADGMRGAAAAAAALAAAGCGSNPGSLNDVFQGQGEFDCAASALGVAASGYYGSLPCNVHMKFNAHEGEVNAVRWSPVERMVATGGADRKVNLWDVGKLKMESRGSLVGSNAGINSVDFDSTGTMLLATSNDFASRVWTVADRRLRHTLTGHSGKVMAAKFLGEPSKVVTGSHDRTLKIWDLRSRACISTKFAGSSCNDLVTTDGAGSTIISGHYDKKIRFWDTRTECPSNDIELQGKITSLDLSRDGKHLISCVRDDTIKLMDLRMNQTVRTFSDDNFRVGCDWARVTLSSDGSKLAAGSADGSVYVWDVCGRLETVLKEQHTVAVTAVNWHPFSSALASVDRNKQCIIWSDT